MISLVFLVACTGAPGPGFNGTKLSDYFPMEGGRSATYVNADATVPYKLEMEKLDQPEQIGERQVWTFEYYEDETFSLIAAVKWSNVSGDAAYIHAWAGADGVFTPYDPPISVTADNGYMHVGDVVTTDSGGVTWTSTYVGTEDCPVQWGLDWEDCAHMKISDGGADPSAADPATRPFFVGDYWVVPRYMIAWMDVRGYDDKWNLADYDYDTGA
jgi:hypothetical protein